MLIKNADPDKYSNILIVDIALDSIHIHFFQFQTLIWIKMLLQTIVHQHILIIQKIYILVLSEGPMQGLDGTAVTADAKYSINFPKPRNKYCITMKRSFSYVSGVKNVLI